MYFKGDNAIWDAGDLDNPRSRLLSKAKLMSPANEEVLLMWRGHIKLKYLFIVDDGGQTVEPYQDFVDRVTALRRRELCLRKKHTDEMRERGRWHLADDSQEVSACA